MGTKAGATAVVLGMDPVCLCCTDLSPLLLTRQPAALRGHKSMAPAASFRSSCHRNVISSPEKLAASPQILSSISLLLEPQKYLHSSLSVFPNSCLNFPQKHPWVFFFFSDNLFSCPTLASLRAVITEDRDTEAVALKTDASRKQLNRTMNFYMGDDSSRKRWRSRRVDRTCTDWTQTTVVAAYTDSHPKVQVTNWRTLQATAPSANKFWLNIQETLVNSKELPPSAWCTKMGRAKPLPLSWEWPQIPWKQTWGTCVIKLGGISGHTQHKHMINLPWNGLPGLNSLSSTLCKSSWWKVLVSDLHAGVLITTGLGPG